ncbi:MAG: PP2C family protein-serine/threonine phosphatase [bacterium]
MAKSDIHIETQIAQTAKHAGDVCGDVVLCDRDEHATLLLLCDGIGSGIRANIAATLCAARLRTLIQNGFSLRHAVSEVATTMEQAKPEATTYCAFTAARILNDGNMTALSYEIPPPLLYSRRTTSPLPTRSLTVGKALLLETHCVLQPDEAIILVSDGITQAGIGTRFHQAWGVEGVARFLTQRQPDHDTLEQLPPLIMQEAVRLGDGGTTDDQTVLLASCRPSKTLTIFTGPPSVPHQDAKVVQRFLDTTGWKAICGGTTARIVSDFTGKPLILDQTDESLIAPPSSRLEGIDLLTEGAMTLNQVYNILDADPETFDEESGVTQLFHFMRAADRIHFIMGGSLNPAFNHISFKQRGVLPRATIVPLLADKLRAQGKRVVIEPV